VCPFLQKSTDFCRKKSAERGTLSVDFCRKGHTFCRNKEICRKKKEIYRFLYFCREWCTPFCRFFCRKKSAERGTLSAEICRFLQKSAERNL
jgi:hypothetical protein